MCMHDDVVGRGGWFEELNFGRVGTEVCKVFLLVLNCTARIVNYCDPE